jgi:hypothetical protein
LGVPVVVLTSDPILRFPEASNWTVLRHPVLVSQILEALERLGVSPGEAC